MAEKGPESPEERLALCIFRLEKTEFYFKVANSVFDDPRLSWEARGLLGYLLSKPDDWQVRLYDLIRRGPAGEHKMRRMLRELEGGGYMYRRRYRRADGTFEWIVLILEHPSLARTPYLKAVLGTRAGHSSTSGLSTDG